MTESDWLSSDDPMLLVRHLGEHSSPRKLRLFACGCARRLGHRWTDPASQAAVLVAEQFADGAASERDLDRAREAAWEAYWHILHNDQSAREKKERGPGPTALRAAQAAVWSTCRSAWEGCLRVAQASAGAAEAAWAGAVAGERQTQAALLREIFGNPFRRSAGVAGAELGGRGRELAARIYAAEAFTELPALAEALMDAGCRDEPLMAHCHQPGGHVRGCWAVDDVLGKQ